MTDAGFYTLLHSTSSLGKGLFKDVIAATNSQNQDRFNTLFLAQTDKAVVLEKDVLYHGIANWLGQGSVSDGANSFAVVDSKGRSWSQFADQDYVTFALTDESDNTIDLGTESINTASIFFTGDSSYFFKNGNLNSNIIDAGDSTFGVSSLGKLVLGQAIDTNMQVTDETFSGLVDLTNTDNNTFEGGVDIYGGTLKVASNAQLGTALDNVALMGSDQNVATLAIAEGSTLHFMDETLTVNTGSVAALDVEKDSDVTFEGTGLNQSGITVDGGKLALSLAQDTTTTIKDDSQLVINNGSFAVSSAAGALFEITNKANGFTGKIMLISRKLAKVTLNLPATTTLAVIRALISMVASLILLKMQAFH